MKNKKIPLIGVPQDAYLGDINMKGGFPVRDENGNVIGRYDSGKLIKWFKGQNYSTEKSIELANRFKMHLGAFSDYFKQESDKKMISRLKQESHKKRINILKSYLAPIASIFLAGTIMYGIERVALREAFNEQSRLIREIKSAPTIEYVVGEGDTISSLMERYFKIGSEEYKQVEKLSPNLKYWTAYNTYQERLRVLQSNKLFSNTLEVGKTMKIPIRKK